MHLTSGKASANDTDSVEYMNAYIGSTLDALRIQIYGRDTIKFIPYVVMIQGK